MDQLCRRRRCSSRELPSSSSPLFVRPPLSTARSWSTRLEPCFCCCGIVRVVVAPTAPSFYHFFFFSSSRSLALDLFCNVCSLSPTIGGAESARGTAAEFSSCRGSAASVWRKRQYLILARIKSVNLLSLAPAAPPSSRSTRSSPDCACRSSGRPPT